MTDAFAALRARFGPGLIFAAAAVGTSHVVQATRAGAGFGLTLIVLILIVCALKYPLFRFAADYAAITDENLVRGYGRRGRWLVVVMFVTSAIEAVAATAGVSLVTAAIMQWILGTTLNAVLAAIALLAGCACVIALGRYRLLESLTGLLVILFSILTLIATIACLPLFAGSEQPVFSAFPLTAENWSFAIAVSGWMPIGNTAAIMLAAWVLARKRTTASRLAAIRFDFNTGYLAAVVLAVCFLVIGAAVLHGQGESMPGASAAFVTAFVGLYTQAIGTWSTLLVSVAALAVMLSTLLAIVDGFPRMIAEFIAELGHNPDGDSRSDKQPSAEGYYLPAMVIVVLAAGACLYFFLDSFSAFIDLVTITGFLAAPVVALANQLAVTGSNVPESLQPGSWLIRWNQLAVALLSLATIGFLYLRFL